jgi:hypothetical protein
MSTLHHLRLKSLNLGGSNPDSLATPVHVLRYIRHSSPVFSGLVNLGLNMFSADMPTHFEMVPLALDTEAHSHDTASELRELLAHLPELQSLSFEGANRSDSTALPPPAIQSGPMQLPHLHSLDLNKLDMTGTGLVKTLQALTINLQSLSLRSSSIADGTWRSVFSVMVSELNLDHIVLRELRAGQAGPYVNFVDIARERPYCFTSDMQEYLLRQLRLLNVDTTQFIAHHNSMLPELNDGWEFVIPMPRNVPVFEISLERDEQMDDVKYWMTIIRNQHMLV